MRRFSFISIFSVIYLNAALYDTNLMQIYAKLLPRIILYSSLKPKPNETLALCIAHNALDYQQAVYLKKRLEQANRNFSPYVTTAPFTSLKQCEKSQLVFFLNSSEEQLQTALRTLPINKQITVSYDAQNLQNGVDASLFIGRSVRPYLNVDALNARQITIHPMLLRTSKLYIKDKQ